jgi:hypothetical protein
MKLFFLWMAIAMAQPTTQDDNDYRWLYEILFPAEIREQLPEESFKSFRVHLKDSDGFFPNPSEITRAHLRTGLSIRGFITYGIFRKKYNYDVTPNLDGSIELKVRVHLKNATEADWISFTDKVQLAQNLWNQSTYTTDFPYYFRFELVRNPAQVPFSVMVMDRTNGPYDQFWSRDWTPNVLAHEIGHMMGLGDEYQTLSGTFDCYRPSLMCTAWTGGWMPHHSYFVLRRLVAR